MASGCIFINQNVYVQNIILRVILGKSVLRTGDGWNWFRTMLSTGMWDYWLQGFLALRTEGVTEAHLLIRRYFSFALVCSSVEIGS
jgi:hypothetical protein